MLATVLVLDLFGLHTHDWSMYILKCIYRWVDVEPHPLGGVSGFALACGGEDVFSHGRGEVRRGWSYLSARNCACLINVKYWIELLGMFAKNSARAFRGLVKYE